jgi:hypothetical protein
MRREAPHNKLYRRVIRGTLQSISPDAYAFCMWLYWKFHNFGRVEDDIYRPRQGEISTRRRHDGVRRQTVRQQRRGAKTFWKTFWSG